MAKKPKQVVTPYRARCLIARILHDLENLVLPPADVARQARRLRNYIEVATGNPLPVTSVDDEERYVQPKAKPAATSKDVRLRIADYCDAYLQANGHEVRGVTYASGWYYINGSAYRASQIDAFIRNLRARNAD